MPEMLYRFSHSIWRRSILGTMLKEQERNLHRKIALVLEGDGMDAIADVTSALKLFRHWKASGDLMKASSLARKIGAHLELLHFNSQAIEIYLEAIDLWTIDSGGVGGKKSVTELKQEILEKVTPEELDCITRLYTSVGRADSFMYTTGGAHLRSIHKTLSQSQAASRLKDRSVWFPVLSGLINLVFFGMIKDDTHAYSRQLVDQFVCQAQEHGKQIHILHALASKSWVHSFNGELDEAISTHERLAETYNTEQFSSGLASEYGYDRAAQTYGLCALHLQTLGCFRESDEKLGFVLEKVIPKLPERDFHSILCVLLPILWVLVENGMAKRAQELFLTNVYDPFYCSFSEGAFTLFLFYYEHLRYDLWLASDAAEDTTKHIDNIIRKDYTEIEEWVLNEKYNTIKSPRHRWYCTILGRDPHCVVSEICWHLASAREPDNKKEKILSIGLSMIEDSEKFTRGVNEYKYARRRSEKLYNMYINKPIER